MLPDAREWVEILGAEVRSARAYWGTLGDTGVGGELLSLG